MPSRVIISSVKTKHAEKRRRAGLERRRSQVPFDVVLDASCGSPHVDGERGHRNRRDDREHAFPERLVGRAREQERRRRC